MQDLCFYEAGCSSTSGMRGLLVLCRRLLRRLLLPIFQRQREIYEHQERQLEQLQAELKSLARAHAELAHELTQRLEEHGRRLTEGLQDALARHRAELAPCLSDYTAIVQRMMFLEAALEGLTDKAAAPRAA